MKIKDILGEAEVTLKPMPGAQEVDVDGKAVGTATTPDAANTIADLAKKGEFTPAGEETTSEDTETPYFVDNSTGKPMIKSGNGLTPVQASKLWFELTPEVEAKAHSQGFRKIMISVQGKQLPGLEGGGKVIVSPRDFQAMSMTKEETHHDLISQGNHDVGGDATDSFIDQVRDREFERKNRSPSNSTSTIGGTKLKESDELMKWLTIAGIK
jgi:hypothetical protein